MIKIEDFNVNDLRDNEETLQDVINSFMKKNKIREKDIINLTYPKPYIASLVYIDWEED
jgi:hypothetical protein